MMPGWDPVPWMIGGYEAEHSADLGRMMAYFMMGGIDGVFGRFDLRVVPSNPPGPSYQVMPGGLAINSAWQPIQAYADFLSEATEWPSGPKTPSTQGRSDLVVANIRDPYAPGSPWDPPADTVYGPYIETTIISGVPQSTRAFADLGITNWSALELARFDLPPNEQNITDGVIEDLRRVSNPLTGPEPNPENPTPAGASPFQTEGSRCVSSSVLPSGSGWKTWPAEADWSTFQVPPWATGVDVFVMFKPEMHGNAWGSLRLVIDGSTGIPTAFDDNYPLALGAGGLRTTMMVSGTQPIPPESRGKNVNVHLEGQQESSGGGVAVGDLVADPGCYVYISLNFKQQPSYV